MLDISEVKARLQKEPTEKLINILSYSQDDYEPQVIPVIREVLEERLISTDDINKAFSTYSQVLNNVQPLIKGQTRQTKTSKFLIWMLWIAGVLLLLCIKKAVEQAMINNLSN